jgi:hypothetical protein
VRWIFGIGGGLFTATYVASMVRLLVWLCTGDASGMFSPEIYAGGFAFMLLFYVVAALSVETGETLAAVTIAIVLGPIVGGLLGLFWSLLVWIFGGGFAASPIYFGGSAGLAIAIWIFIELNAALGDPVTPAKSSIFAGMAEVVSSVKFGASILGHGVSAEVTLRDRPSSDHTSPPAPPID